MARPLSRSSPAPPVRLAHLGLGAFFRAHQAWYTDRGGEAGIAAFTGRSPRLADALSAQDGVFTLVTRGPDADRFDLVASVVRAHAAADHEAWLACLAAPDLQAVTTTVTEAAYLRGADGGLDRDREDVRADADALARDLRAPVRTVPGRLVAGLAARRAAGAGPIALVPCDNLPDNGAVVARLVREMAELVDPALAAWTGEEVAAVSTVVDRITPAPTEADVRTVREATGREDRAPVVTEPFSEWVLAGEFPGGRPRWEDAGATFADDAGPFEQRKLWLLNGAHSLLAYAGGARGHEMVADAIADDRCRAWVEQWWDEASPYLTLPGEEIAAYRAALLERWANARIRHRLAQIAADGSQKVPVRVVPVLRQERAAGRMPAGAVIIVGAWLAHLRGAGPPVTDARADDVVPRAAGPLKEAAARVLEGFSADLAADDELVDAVAAVAAELAG